MNDRYKLNSIVVKFFDFYSMYELYMRAGGFREEGYKDYAVFINEDIWERIVSKYETTVDEFYDLVYKALVYSVESELRHFPKQCIRCRMDSTKDFYKDFCQKAGIEEEMINKTKRNVEAYPEIAVKIYSIPKWDSCYGGKRWAAGAQMLVESKKVKTRHQKVFWCDRVLDLYHNSGHLLNKTDFQFLSEYCITPPKGKMRTPLDVRAKSKSVLNFLPYVSTSVAKLVIPRKNLLDSNPKLVLK